jgi:hypothetical protein
MRRLPLLFVLLFVLPCVLAAEERWIKYTSGPFEVFASAGQRGRETMVRFEEFRHALGEVVGETDMQTPQPVRILLFRDARGWDAGDPVARGRDRYVIVLEEQAAVSPAVWSNLTRLFLAANTAQMPPAFEHGLVEFFSTFDVKGIQIAVGAPPPQPDLDWARIHLLVTAPEYFGRLKVLLYNLRRGVDEDPAYHNAYGKSAAEIEALVRQHFAAGNFQPGTISSLPMAAKDFVERPVADSDARLARADLLAGDQSAAEYTALLRAHVKIAEAEEGLGLLALRDHHNDEARRHFSAAINAPSTSARCYIEYAKLETDNAKATHALLRATELNPKLDEPFALLAARDTDPIQRAVHWKAAAERNPRNPAYWKSLAECYLAAHNYADAAKAWRSGEQAATDPAERDRMHQARVSIEQQRADYEEAERQRKADEDARAVAALKQKALAQVHALEAKYNEGATKPGQKPMPWWDGPQPTAKIHGMLKQVECLGSQARVIVDTDGRKTIRLLVADSSKVAILGAGAQMLGCGRQTPRAVAIAYFPKPNARLGTAGEVATIEFQ